MERIFKFIALIGAIIIAVTAGASDNGTLEITNIVFGGSIGLLMLIVGLKGSKIMQ